MMTLHFEITGQAPVTLGVPPRRLQAGVRKSAEWGCVLQKWILLFGTTGVACTVS